MSQLEDLLQQCTVKLTLGGSQGTGFFVAPEWILTCAHVVKGAEGRPIQVRWQNHENWAEAVVERSLPDPYDLALLRITLPTNANPPCVHLDAAIQSRDPLYLFGYPDQDFPNGCPVTFSCEGLTGDEPALIKFALGQVRPGMSGAPLLNQRTGMVCGIVKFTRDRSFDLGGGAVPTAVILDQFPELLEQQQSFHQVDQRWLRQMQGAIAANPATLPSTRATLSLSAYDAATWVGRESLVTTLTRKLKDGCRILALTGITGIGKTALAERLVVEVSGSGIPFHRLNFDDRGQGRDFLSGALAVLPKLGETVTTEDQKDPQNALTHLLRSLRNKQFLLQIDSLEMLLQGDEQTGWNAFVDPLWVDFFQQILAGEDCQSQLLVTTQVLSEELEMVGSNYPRYWHRQDLTGLLEAEQIELFEKNGLKLDDVGTETLKRIGTLYQGHPLVIQVIARDILDKPFNGNVQLYWQRYQSEFSDVERDKQKGSPPRALQLQVKRRVEQSLQRLPPDVYQMLCRSSVYRRPVPEEFWLAMVADIAEDRQWAALELLKSRNLAEEELSRDGVLLLRQHNLVKSVARTSLQTDVTVWQKAEHTAAQVWLNEYEPEPNAPNLEQVRGYLESFHHYSELKLWQEASRIIFTRLNRNTEKELHIQLQIWGYCREAIYLYTKIIKILPLDEKPKNIIIWQGLGDAYNVLCDFSKATKCYEKVLEIADDIEPPALAAKGKALGSLGDICHWNSEYDKAIEYHKKHLSIASQIKDNAGTGKAYYNLGNACNYLGDYSQSISYSIKALALAKNIGDRVNQVEILGNLGIAYRWLGRYSEAIKSHQQQLELALEIGYRHGEGFALGCFGVTYHQLNDYHKAVEYHLQHLKIACEIGDPFAEGNARGNLAQAYTSLGEYPKAEKLYQEYLEISRKIGDRDGEASSLAGIGKVLIRNEQYPKSLEYLQKALVIFNDIKSQDSEADVLYRLAKVYKKLGRRKLAISHCKKALKIATKLGVPLAQNCKQLKEQLEPTDVRNV